MVERAVKVTLENGLQAKPAAEFVQLANRFSAEIFLAKDEKKVNAKSIMGLMSLAITTGETINLIADGEDELEALDQLETFVQKEG